AAGVVDVLRRGLATPSTPKALVAYAPADRSAEIRQSFKESGFVPMLAKNIKEAFEKYGAPADFDVVFLHGSAGNELPFAIAQLRGDADQGNVPIFMLTSKENEYVLGKLAARHRHVKAVPAALLMVEDELKNQMEEALKETSGAKLSSAERKELNRVALDYLWRMARNEIPGYDVRPALPAVVAALRSPEPATEA